MNELILYRCNICENLICMVNDSGIVPECCGLEMDPVIANTEDAAAEKHVPVMQQNGTSVRIHVGSMPHPMTAEHYISHIVLLTDRGAYVRRLNPSDAPEAEFIISPDEKAEAVYEWCSLHGLWKN